MKPGAKKPVGVAWAQFVAVKEQAQKLAAQGKTEQAIQVCNDFVRAHADAQATNPNGFGILASVVSGLLERVADPQAKGEQLLKLWNEFPEVLPYRCMAAAQ